MDHVVFPALTAGLYARDLYSGESSVGGAIGSYAGMLGGYKTWKNLLGKRLLKSLPSEYSGKNWKGKLAKFIMQDALGTVVSVPTALIGSTLGEKYAPIYRRTPKVSLYE